MLWFTDILLSMRFLLGKNEGIDLSLNIDEVIYSIILRLQNRSIKMGIKTDKFSNMLIDSFLYDILSLNWIKFFQK